jgi:adenylate cyclase
MMGAARRTIRTIEGAIAFTDLVGFTEFTAVSGDAAALALLSLQERLVKHEMARRGRIVKNLGDGLMLWFEHPRDAVRTGLALQERFEEHSNTGELPLWVRVGVHFGHPARRGRDLVGHDVNVAARIVELAAPGEVLVSQAAVQNVGELPGVTFEEVGPTLMKGIPKPIALYRAVGCPTSSPRTGRRPRRRRG